MRGDGKTAKQLADQGRAEDQLMREAHAKASMIAFNTQNRDLNTLYTIDLHGLFVNEALDRLEQHIKLARQNNISMLKKYNLLLYRQANSYNWNWKT
jgi:DNA-nicking Smr family endonuclease